MAKKRNAVRNLSVFLNKAESETLDKALMKLMAVRLGRHTTYTELVRTLLTQYVYGDNK